MKKLSFILCTFLILIVMGCQNQDTLITALEYELTLNKEIKMAYNVDLVWGSDWTPPANTIESTKSGKTTKNRLHAMWRGFNSDGISFYLDDGSNPNDRAELFFFFDKGKVKKIVAIALLIYDSDGTGYRTDRIYLDTPVLEEATGFTIHVHEENISVYMMTKNWDKLKEENNKGSISIGDIEFESAL